MQVRLGIFVVPDATDPRSTVEQILAAERSGLDFVGVQDHPYQWRFFDTWTLLAYAAARTESVRFVTDVLNLPLRLPAVIAKSAASLDVLSGGRLELGLGAGAFWDGVEAMGGPRRTPKESVDALEEAVAVLKGFWSGERSVTVEGEHYRVKGAWQRELEQSLGPVRLIAAPIPHDCVDGFYGAFWRRPVAYLDSSVRDGISVFSALNADDVTRAVRELDADLHTGAWDERHPDIRNQSELHLGYYAVTAELS